LPLKLNFVSVDKIREMYERYGSARLLDRSAMKHGIEIGRGGIWLKLTDDQYSKLYAGKSR